VSASHRAPHPTPPYRVLFKGAATAAWYNADAAEKARALERLIEVCAGWRARDDARFLASVDDDLFLVGNPAGLARWSIFLVFEIDEAKTAASMIDDCRQCEVRLDRYFTFDVAVGRAFFPIE
jgi:hypothetical protein